MTRDDLPEHQDWTDDGCDLHPQCQTCPLSRCRYEMAAGQARAELQRIRLMDLLAEGKTMDEAAAVMGISRRTSYRLRGPVRPAKGGR